MQLQEDFNTTDTGTGHHLDKGYEGLCLQGSGVRWIIVPDHIEQ